MGLWGGSRSTVDLDFLIYRDDMTKVHGIMSGLGYELRHHSEYVSQYLSPLDTFGEIDIPMPSGRRVLRCLSVQKIR